MSLIPFNVEPNTANTHLEPNNGLNTHDGYDNHFKTHTIQAISWESHIYIYIYISLCTRPNISYVAHLVIISISLWL